MLTTKQIYESSFHPDTGQKQNVFGRMCFQVPGGMAITGAMLSFYKYLILITMHNALIQLFKIYLLRTVPAVVFWQWINQSFNALVNYTNRNANSPLSQNQMATAYGSATLAACVTSIKFKQFLSSHASPFFQVK